jgi:hypothetical protein
MTGTNPSISPTLEVMGSGIVRTGWLAQARNRGEKIQLKI